MERETPGAPTKFAYCPICGREADGTVGRLGEAFCSEAHAEAFEQEVQVLIQAERNRDTSKA